MEKLHSAVCSALVCIDGVFLMSGAAAVVVIALGPERKNGLLTRKWVLE
jgi:hypothetical protein